MASGLGAPRGPNRYLGGVTYRRRARGLASALLVALVAGACGTATESASASLKVAIDETIATGSFRMTVIHRVSDAADPAMLEAQTEGTGFVDLVNDRSRFTVTDNDPTGATFNILATEEIAVGEETWVRGTGVAELVGDLEPDLGAESSNAASDRWFRVPPEGSGAVFVSSLRVHPESLLNRLAEKPSVLRPAGTDLIRGVATRQYVVEASGLTTTNEAYRAGPFEVWIDEQDLLRRIVQSVTFVSNASDPPSTQTLEMTAELFDFGAQEEVLAPPPDQVTAMPLLSGSEPDCIADADSAVVENIQLCSSDDPDISQPPLELPPPPSVPPPRPLSSDR